jgi:hypothetical protein
LFPTVKVLICFSLVLMSIDMAGSPFDWAGCAEEAASVDYVVVTLGWLIEGFVKNIEEG